MHWNEQQTSANWKLDHTQIWSRWSELMKYIVYLLAIVLPVISRRSCFSRTAHHGTSVSGARNDRTVGARNPRLHLSGSVAPQQPWPQSVDFKFWGSCNSGSIRRRSRMWMKWLVEIWICMEQNIINTAVNERRNCLRACVRAKGRHFEPLL